MSEYTDAVEYHLKGCKGVSVGVCPGCEECRDIFAEDMTMEEFEEEWHTGDVCDEGGFSRSRCGICGSRLGGNRYIWHWILVPEGKTVSDPESRIIHEDDCCVDCLMYLANGDEPEEWRRS